MALVWHRMMEKFSFQQKKVCFLNIGYVTFIIPRKEKATTILVHCMSDGFDRWAPYNSALCRSVWWPDGPFSQSGRPRRIQSDGGQSWMSDPQGCGLGPGKWWPRMSLEHRSEDSEALWTSLSPLTRLRGKSLYSSSQNLGGKNRWLPLVWPQGGGRDVSSEGYLVLKCPMERTEQSLWECFSLDCISLVSQNV